MKKFLLILTLAVMTSLSLAASDKDEAKAFDRGVGKMNSVFIPKGYIGGGFTFSYKTYDLGQATDDVGYSMLFSLLSGIKGDMHTLGISPSVSYFLFDNFSVGARFDYSRTNLNVGNLGLSLGDLASLSIQDYHMLKNMYSTAVTARYYMPIANSKRIAMFGEVRLGFDVGQSVTYQTKEGNNFGTFQTIYGGGLNVVPGLCVFATNEVCVEVSVGVLGINYQHVRQQTNLVDESVMQQSGANFKINPLSISLGMSFYIPVNVSGRSKAGKAVANRASVPAPDLKVETTVKKQKEVKDAKPVRTEKKDKVEKEADSAKKEVKEGESAKQKAGFLKLFTPKSKEQKEKSEKDSETAPEDKDVKSEEKTTEGGNK